jgi:hypothetical protein
MQEPTWGMSANIEAGGGAVVVRGPALLLLLMCPFVGVGGIPFG